MRHGRRRGAAGKQAQRPSARRPTAGAARAARREARGGRRGWLGDLARATNFARHAAQQHPWRAVTSKISSSNYNRIAGDRCVVPTQLPSLHRHRPYASQILLLGSDLKPYAKQISLAKTFHTRSHLAKAFLTQPRDPAKAFLPQRKQAISAQCKMLCLPSAASFRPADPAARGALASPQQQQSRPRLNTAAQGRLPIPSAAAFRPADPTAQGAMASKQQKMLRVREFDHFVVIDFEATCEKDSRIYPQEIIEFPAVLVDAATGALLSSFRTYVKPRHHPQLTSFCSELTGIQQQQVDGGVDLATALGMHDSWLASAGADKNRLAVVTWGDWDCKTMLESECSFKCISKPRYFDQWVNLRIPFEAVFGAGQRNLQEAVREAGMQWDGRLHCGLDDACNTARLLVELMRRGASISITGSLPQPPPPLPAPEPELQFQAQMAPVNRNISWCTGGVATTGGCCYCGLPIRGDMVTTPGPMQGRFFFSCGNWSPILGPMCNFFLWAA